MTNCNSCIEVPILEIDECQGNRTNATCVIDPTVYSELNLEANSTQKQINQALYSSALSQKALVEHLEGEVNDFEVLVQNIVISNQVADNTNIADATNVGSMRYRVSGNNSYFDMVMQTSASTYEWVNVVQNSWV